MTADRVGKRDFYEAFKDLMNSYGFVDWAVACRKVDSNMDSFWEAGTGQNPISDRERANMLYAEMGRLQLSVMLCTTPKHKLQL
jgi:hypothetical protein